MQLKTWKRCNLGNVKKKQQNKNPKLTTKTQQPPNNVPNATNHWTPVKRPGALVNPWITAAPNANVRIGGRTNKNTNG
jgi:hypothetical protein